MDKPIVGHMDTDKFEDMIETFIAQRMRRDKIGCRFDFTLRI